MKTWDDWSDLEIDAQVTMVVYNLHDWEYSDNMRQFYHCGACGNETNNQPVINYCNSWADMGPIIGDRKISLHWDWEVMNECSAIGSTYVMRSLGLRQINHEYTSKNPLRAAGIVFLMMNGVNPE